MEGRHHSFELVYCDHDLVDSPFIFSDSIPFGAGQLTKLSAAIPRDGAIGVWPDQNNCLRIWGFEPRRTHRSGPCLRVAVLQPGTIVSGTGGSKYFIFLLSSDKAGFVDQHMFELMKRPLEDSIENAGFDWYTRRYVPLTHVARAMRSHGHGGTLLVVPTEKGSWEKAISSSDGTYKAHPVFDQTKKDIAELHAQTEPSQEGLVSYQRSLDLVGQLTAVDGATVITRDLIVLRFGAKIDCPHSPDQTVRVGEPLEGSALESKMISDLGGTRHQSAARFVRDNHDAIAVVASQDSVLSFVAWDNEAGETGLICVTRHAEWQIWQRTSKNG